MASKDIAERLQAAEQLSALQQHFNELAQEVQQHAERAKQCSAANATCLAYDGAANQKAIYCLKLEQQAAQLDSYMGSRSYGRLHPRYKLSC
ncbi:hypothetical protein OEZ86_011875 [Tetradesmus obliquus]|uniref:Uncharacterized protein n=1 Tax=Tetradesmus obliquus TaxID=3088 RepID=A0A383WG93_TETOB|nr:hypothetical protein OEZ86_011875 [Tetradesmus obliquus]